MIFEDLNPEQRRAVEAVRGPVCILAGAGSGKTTTITRRIAWQVASGARRFDEILAVTFTDKAAGEMRSRLERLVHDGETLDLVSRLAGMMRSPRLLGAPAPLEEEDTLSGQKLT